MWVEWEWAGFKGCMWVLESQRRRNANFLQRYLICLHLHWIYLLHGFPHDKWNWYFGQNFFKDCIYFACNPYIHITKCNLFSCLYKFYGELNPALYTTQYKGFGHPKHCRYQLSWRLVHCHSDFFAIRTYAFQPCQRQCLSEALLSLWDFQLHSLFGLLFK